MMKKIDLLFVFLAVFCLFPACSFDPHKYEKPVDKDKSGYYYYTLGKKHIVYKYKQKSFGIPLGWHREIIEEADPETFTVIHKLYGKDKNNVFYSTYKMDADPVTFELNPENHSYATDKNHVYFAGKRINNADPASFRITDSKARDKDHVFLSLFEDKEKGILKIVDKADPETYTRVNRNFSKDKNAYFYMDERTNADVETFRLLSEDTGIDKDSIYYFRGKVQYGNQKSYRYNGEVKQLAKNIFYDKDRIYNFEKMPVTTISVKNINTLVVLDTINPIIFKVDNRLFWDLQEREKMIDFSTFRYLDKNKRYGADSENIYWKGHVIEGADISTFQVMESGFSSDKNHVYYYNQIFPDADPETFTAIEAEKGKIQVEDKNYRWTKKKDKWVPVEKE